MAPSLHRGTKTKTTSHKNKAHVRAKTKPVSLSAGRPPLAAAPPRTFSVATARRIIRSHHGLTKALARARATGDEATATALAAQLSLPRYQAASLQGQAPSRGGDASTVLVDWLRDYGVEEVVRHRHGAEEGVDEVKRDMENGGEKEAAKHDQVRVGKRRSFSSASSAAAPAVPSSFSSGLRMLDVGALSTRNACARAGIFARVERIDLNSQAPGITRQDFLERPIPPPPRPTCKARKAGKDRTTALQDEEGEDEMRDEGCFDIISLSLVLNYVPDPAQRGDMLRHTTKFFRPQSAHERRQTQGQQTGEEPKSLEEWPFPSLFLVLPLPCVANSRYFDDQRLVLVMSCLGFVLLRRKQTAKLVYYLWRWEGLEAMQGREQVVGKALVSQAEKKGGMNNFRIELKGEP